MKRLAANTMSVELGRPGAHAGALMNSTEELVARVRAGDEEAFRLIFERYSRPLLGFIFDMVGDRHTAEDLAQETFVRAFRGLATLRDESKLSTWLFSIAKNVARESLRERRRGGVSVELDDEEVFFELHDDAPPAASVGAHLSECADCAAALDALRFEHEAYARYDRGLEVTPALWAAVSARVARGPEPTKEADNRPFLARLRGHLAATFGAL